MVCTYVREDNPRALASGLLSIQTTKTYNNLLIVTMCAMVQSALGVAHSVDIIRRT